MPDASGFFYARSSQSSKPYLRILESLPKPAAVWHTVPANKEQQEAGFPWSHERWKPSVYKVLDALHGTRGRMLDELYWYQVGGEKFPRYEVERPSMQERKSRFLQALGIVYAFRSWADLVPIAVYRRQVTNVGGVHEIDQPFYLLMMEAVRERYFRPKEIAYIAERMPPCSAVRRMVLGLQATAVKAHLSKVLGSEVY